MFANGKEGRQMPTRSGCVDQGLDRRKTVRGVFAESVQQFMGSSVRLPYFSAPDAAACWQWLRELGLAVGKAEQ